MDTYWKRMDAKAMKETGWHIAYVPWQSYVLYNWLDEVSVLSGGAQGPHGDFEREIHGEADR